MRQLNGYGVKRKFLAACLEETGKQVSAQVAFLSSPGERFSRFAKSERDIILSLLAAKVKDRVASESCFPSEGFETSVRSISRWRSAEVNAEEPLPIRLVIGATVVELVEKDDRATQPSACTPDHMIAVSHIHAHTRREPHSAVLTLLLRTKAVQ